MEYLIRWLIVFVVIYLIYFLFVILRKKKVKDFKENTYIKYLIRVYKLDKNKLNSKKMLHLVSLANAFIIATTYIIISSIKNFIIMLLLAFVVLIPMQLLVYHIIGKILKKGEVKNV